MVSRNFKKIVSNVQKIPENFKKIKFSENLKNLFSYVCKPLNVNKTIGNKWLVFRSTPKECLSPTVLKKLILNAKAIKRSLGDKKRGYSEHHILLMKELESETA